MTKACKEHGGFYLGSIGGPAAILAQNCIKKVIFFCLADFLASLSLRRSICTAAVVPHRLPEDDDGIAISAHIRHACAVIFCMFTRSADALSFTFTCFHYWASIRTREHETKGPLFRTFIFTSEVEVLFCMRTRTIPREQTNGVEYHSPKKKESVQYHGGNNV